MSEQEPPKNNVIPLFKKKSALESALYQFFQTDAFYASFLQEISIQYTESIPTARMKYDKEKNEFKMLLNPNFFCSYELPQRVALLFHEALHFMNQHLFRFSYNNLSPEDAKLQNIAQDMAINQFITNLPEGGIDIKNFKHVVNGKEEPMPEKKPAELYLELLKDPKNKKANQKELDKYIEGEGPNDIHSWGDLSEEEKQRMLTEAKKVIERTIEKSSTSHSSIPDSIKDLLQTLESEIRKLDYKGILRRVIKKTLSVADRTHTWNRPSKRYGVYSQGTEVGKLPNCLMTVDTSGSISHRELSEFLACISGFLKVGGKKCELSLWHTNLYHTQKYKLHQELDPSVMQSGGTDIKEALEQIAKKKPNLAIILTDGYYDSRDVPIKTEVLFIISKGGNKDHPMKHIGHTITLESLL